MNTLLRNYSTLVFDCDGVILDSNSIKTEAFRAIALPWGEDAADELVSYHVANGGISRHNKISYFLNHILPARFSRDSCGSHRPSFDKLLSNYAKIVRDGLINCPIAERLEDLRLQTSNSNWCIVSGSDQTELRQIFSARKLDHLFDGGIFGSPDDKDSILARELARGSIRSPSLFLGDSRYDHMASSRAGLDFLFVSSWTDFENWEKYVSDYKLPTVCCLADLLTANSKLSLRERPRT